ncbi:unnamed protein product [Mytilus coruscus]|uniref:Mutator-like transposase domain-containing protein n=1 Tax=Mytilus coruscus TaxID=42192 RepID=A0A6J8BYB8_MYTCO|nr:unnamed protein product [Mytilus coruscus]
MFADIDIGADVSIPPDPSHNDSWKEGRPVVELLELAQNLVCQMCNCPLNLIDTVSERKYGFGSVFTIPCGSCTTCNSVETGKRNTNGGFVVNSKAAIGMGATHVNNFLAGLNVPLVHSSTIRKKEKEIGKKIQEVATESCKSVHIKEKDLSNGKLLKSRATAARDFLPIVQPTAFRVLTKATSLLLFTVKPAADARPMALQEKFLFLCRELDGGVDGSVDGATP